MLLVRRSHSQDSHVGKTTKQKVKYRIHLPPEVMDVLRWHVETQLVTPEQQESDLLFPSIKGGFRSTSCLNKPFADAAATMELATNPDFQQAVLNVNVVLRWEYVLGSTLYLVYTRSQLPAVMLSPGESASLNLTSVSRAPAADVVLAKLTYFWAG